ncbi:MAG: DUF4270 domain-containing protein [Muribaculaceae bacterium]|nr:DUF4270 domain-containing protein [Muribaculaceae bacterium]
MTQTTILRRYKRIFNAFLLATIIAGIFSACENNVPTVGSDLASNEVQIALDSLIWNNTDQYIHRGDKKVLVACPKIPYATIYDDSIDARSTNNLIGRISVPEYGDLRCSFVSRMMCATKLAIPDSIRYEQIDSMKLLLRVQRGDLTGDSLAPQQLKVYQLTKSLPSDIDNRFDPTGYYDPSAPIGTRSYTLSALGMSDSLFKNLKTIFIEIPMSKKMAQDTYLAYKTNPSVFAWPQTFEQYFHGIYVEPTFGRGCVANIQESSFVIFYSYKTEETKKNEDGTSTVVVKTKSSYVGVFQSSPIVLNSNNVIYQPSQYLQNLANQNEALLTTPGGYRVNFKFPAKELIDIYNTSQSKLAVVSDLKFSIPVEEISNDYGITPPPYLLMIKKSKLKEFFANNSLPDNKESFYATYNATTKQYSFSSMRNYILDLIKNGVKEDDLEFTIVPVNLEFEKNESNNNYNPYLYYYYGYNTNTATESYLTKCTPYIVKPTMCRLIMDKAQTIFTYTIQQMQ